MTAPAPDPQLALEQAVVQAALSVEVYEREEGELLDAWTSAGHAASAARERLETATRALRSHLASTPPVAAGNIPGQEQR